MALDLATIAAPPARDETPARPGPAKESAAVLERASISWLFGFWQFGAQKEKTTRPDLNLPVTSL